MKFTDPVPDEDLIVDVKILFTGEVWIGDPCYVVPNKDWKDFCHFVNKRDMIDGLIVSTPKGKLFVWETKYGDGRYPALNGHRSIIGECLVDSGLLCVMYVDTAMKLFQYKKKDKRKELNRIGVIVEDVSGEARVSNHDLELGDVVVYTSETADDVYKWEDN